MKSFSLLFAFGLLLSVFLWPPAQAATSNSATPTNQKNLSIKLGNVTVHGQKVIEVLQAIKLALRQPESSDPKLANMIVCRIHPAVGSHSQQVLTCATNKTLLKRAADIHLAFLVSMSGGEDALFAALNEVLVNQPGQELNMRLKGNGFRSLLRQIPLPAPGETGVAIPAAVPTLLTGQGANEMLQLGRLKITGQPMITKVLQTLKLGLHQPFSSNPALADIVVCRLNGQSGNQSNQTLLCATNQVWSAAHSPLHTVMAKFEMPPSGAVCSAHGCDAAVVAQFNSALASLPDHYMTAPVDSVQLHRLLESVPYPAKTPAPSGATHGRVEAAAA